MTTNRRKAQNLIIKLKRLECPVLKNSDDAWAMEVLFKPNFERYEIIEWILSKLEFHIPDVSKIQNSSERKAANLLTAVSGLGLCSEKDSNIIQGTASSKEQLRFWNLLVNILWKQSLLQKSGNVSTDRISEEYRRSCDYLHKLCENVSFKALFFKKLQLLPPHVLKDCAEKNKILSSKTQSLKDIKGFGNAILKNMPSDMNVSISDVSKQLGSIEFNDAVLTENEKLIDLEANISSSLSDLQECACSNFKEAYLNLKPYLSNVSPNDTIDVGPQFKEAHLQLESFTNINKSLSLIKESEHFLTTLNTDLKDYNLCTEPLSGSLTGEYIAILNDCKFSEEK